MTGLPDRQRESAGRAACLLLSAVLALAGAGGVLAQSGSEAPDRDHFLDLGDRVARKAPAATASLLEDRNHISVIELAGDYDRDLADGSFNAEPRQAIARAFYDTHPDIYDFLVVFTTFEFDTGAARAFHVGVRNDVLGLGLPVFDSSDLYGSAGRLQSYVDMAALGRHASSPLEAGFEETLAVLSHEMMHRWGARVEGSLGDLILSSDRAHWSFFLQSGASVMYGNDWRDNGDGSFTSIGAFKFYGPLDLYLAGFYAPEEVPPFFVLQGPDAERDRRELGATVSAPAIPLAIDDVIAANGPRIPPAAEAQRDFRAAFVLVVRPGEQVTEAAIVGLESLREELLVRFPILTGGRGVLEAPPGSTFQPPFGGPGIWMNLPRQSPSADRRALLVWWWAGLLPWPRRGWSMTRCGRFVGDSAC